MAVYERTYRGYAGPLTNPRERFLVIPRYAFREVFKSRLFISFFSACFFLPLLFAFAIYIQHNLKALANLPFDPSEIFPIDAYSFYWFMNTQGMVLGFMMLLVVGPPLISKDLRNNALPLYLGRPFAPAEYILGKLSVLASLLSLITWVPGLLLFGLAAYFKGWPWLTANASVGIAVFASATLFIAFMSILTLALSAWAKWKPLTSGLLIGLYVVSQGFASALNETFETTWGDVVSIPRLLQSVWLALFAQPGGETIPPAAALFVLALLSLFCLALLHWKVRPYNRPMTDSKPRDIRFENVSKFYGEVLGVNRVELSIPSGITSLVGPNGSGKTTLMNLMTGLLQPSRGRIRVLGLDLTDRERLFREVGYCTQYDSFPRGVNGWEFLTSTLRLHGYTSGQARKLAEVALERVDLIKAAGRVIAGYSKGMRQRVKLAQAICHQPSVLVLDEPLNGLDPLARAEVIELFREWAGAGLHLIISSHILHEVDMISDQVVILSSGYVVAEGSIRAMRTEVKSHPLQILVRCADPGALASRLFEEDHIVEVKMHDDRRGLLVRTRDAEACWKLLNRVVLERGISVDAMAPNDDDVHSLYDYLIGEGESAA